MTPEIAPPTVDPHSSVPHQSHNRNAQNSLESFERGSRTKHCLLSVLSHLPSNTPHVRALVIALLGLHPMYADRSLPRHATRSLGPNPLVLKVVELNPPPLSNKVRWQRLTSEVIEERFLPFCTAGIKEGAQV